MKPDVELWLYGSRARGDADAASDSDVLAIADPDVDITAAVAQLEFPRMNVSVYSWAELERMHSYGSLYLHHIAQDGQRLTPSTRAPQRMPRLLAAIPPFSRAREDLAGFRRALEEGRRSLEDGGWPDFECEVIATVARHAAILGSYCLAEPTFGREEPFYVVARALGYESARVEALVRPATAWRLHRRRVPSSADDRTAWLTLVRRFFDDLQPVIDDYSALLSRAA